MKKNILIDLDRLKNIHTGLGQVSLNFGKELAKIKDEDLHFTFLLPKEFVNSFGTNVSYEVVSLKRRWFPAMCKDYDLWHSLHQDASYLPGRRNMPYVLTVHDLNFLSEKSPGKAKKRLKILQKKIDRASEIVAISDFTKNKIEKHLDISGKEVKLIYNGVEVLEFPESNKPEFVPEGEFLLSIGVIKEKKNVEVLLPFLEKLPDNYTLIIAGDKSSAYAKKIQSEISRKSLSDRIIMPGEVSDEEKYWLLKNCSAVLFPSKFEGMGMPPIEAMRLGKAVLASSFSSIPEICRDKAFYWNNFEPDYMVNVFFRSITGFYDNKRNAEEIQEYSKKFLWTKNVQAYLKLYRELLKIS